MSFRKDIKKAKHAFSALISVWVRSIAKWLYLSSVQIIEFSSYRFVVVTLPHRIGHLALEVDWFLKQKALGKFPGVWPILVLPYSETANPALLRIWGRHLRLISNPVLVRILKPFTEVASLRVDLYEVAYALEGAAQYSQAINSWGDRPPIFRLPKDLIENGRAVLEKMGMPRNAWFVCVHARDAIYSPSDEFAHNFRNSDINRCNAAVDAIIARGGWCVRIGERGTPSLSERPGLINYPDTPFHSDWMDLFLTSQARFCLGNTSGICLIATIAGVPCALANMMPYGACYGMGLRDISIPKGLRRQNGEVPSLPEIFASDVANFRFAEFYAREGWQVEENTEAQICELAMEMLDRLEGAFRTEPADEVLQDAFRHLLTPQHYTHGTRSRIGTAFLRLHAAQLLNEEVAPQAMVRPVR